jgi:hypothetical protein
MILKTLNLTTWKEIKIGEIFCEDTLEFDIFEKQSNTSARFLATTCFDNCSGVHGEGIGKIIEDDDIVKWDDKYGLYYKLPKSVQKLFKEE